MYLLYIYSIDGISNMKNKDFFYLQYDQIDWSMQEETKINFFVNNYIIDNIILKDKLNQISIFDIGFGIGFFIKMLLNKSKLDLYVEGCEPSVKNYNYLLNNTPSVKYLKLHNKTFLDCKTDYKFNFITSIYVFPHLLKEELDLNVKKIYSLLKENGKFILVVANEKYLLKKLKDKKDLFIENDMIIYNNKEYMEILHYSDIPKIGKVIDYNREERFYLDLFKNNNFKLDLKQDLNDNGFICTIFIFSKN